MALDVCGNPRPELSPNNPKIYLTPNSNTQLAYHTDPHTLYSCGWSYDDTSFFDSGLRLTTAAWGNFPGDEILLGCRALIDSREYKNFAAEMICLLYTSPSPRD